MGVVYKLKPEIVDFIIAEKRNNPKLSCRKLMPLIEEKFQAKVSKSSINFILKGAGLSQPLIISPTYKEKVTPMPLLGPVEAIPEVKGEFFEEKPAEQAEQQQPFVPEDVVTDKPEVLEPEPAPTSEPAREIPEAQEIEAPPAEGECSGDILLRAIDGLLNGSSQIADSLSKVLNRDLRLMRKQIDELIYHPLTQIDISSYLVDLQSIKIINFEISQIISSLFQEVRCIKVNFSESDSLAYLDAQLHTIWSSPHIPFDFSITSYITKSYINKYFLENAPLVLLMAPGYDAPTKDFFTFLSGLDSKKSFLSSLTLYGNKFEELENFTMQNNEKRRLVFGIWPWQFVEFRKITKLGEFKPIYAELLNNDFFAAEAELELTQPQINQSFTVKGYAVKTAISEKTRLLVLSNFNDGSGSAQELLDLYLSCWPNLEEGFQDFSRKIELFTYTGSSRRFFSSEMLHFDTAQKDISALFASYLEAMDLYLRWHFLPPEYEDIDFAAMKERFYCLKAAFKREEGVRRIIFNAPHEYHFFKDLEYCCRRLNEREIILPDKTRLFFLV